MIRAIILAIGLCGVMALTTATANNALPKKRTPLTKEQKTAMKELRDKYDKDGNGKLSKEERAAMSADDKAKMKEFRGGRKKAKSK